MSVFLSIVMDVIVLPMRPRRPPEHMVSKYSPGHISRTLISYRLTVARLLQLFGIELLLHASGTNYIISSKVRLKRNIFN